MNRLRSHIRYYTIVSFLLIATTLLSNDNINRSLGRANAAEDLRIYFKLIDEQHGNPYQFVPRSAFLAAVDQTITALPEQIDVKQFEVELAKLNNLIRCGHTTVNLATEVFKQESRLAQFFPIPVSIIDQRIYVNFDQTDIPHGAELLSINGQALNASLSELIQLTVSDGLGETKSFRELESRFGYYLYLLYGSAENFAVTYRRPDGVISEQNIAPVAGNTMIANNYFRPLY